MSRIGSKIIMLANTSSPILPDRIRPNDLDNMTFFPLYALVHGIIIFSRIGVIKSENSFQHRPCNTFRFARKITLLNYEASITTPISTRAIPDFHPDYLAGSFALARRGLGVQPRTIERKKDQRADPRRFCLPRRIRGKVRALPPASRQQPGAPVPGMPRRCLERYSDPIWSSWRSGKFIVLRRLSSGPSRAEF